MDFIRYGLIACIIAVGLFIAKQWAEFSEDNHLAKTTSSAASYSAPVDELPTVTPSTNTDDELPIVSETVAVAVDEPSVSTASDTDIITVSTPTLMLRISKNGGDVIYASLPKFETSLDEDLGPFTLLEQNPTRTYIAQSGLIGRDGTDKSGNRTQYSSDQNAYILQEGEGTLQIDLVNRSDTANITKRFTFSDDSYAIGVTHIVENIGTNDWIGTTYAQLRRDNSEDPGAASAGFGMKPYLGAATTSPTKNEPYSKVKFDKFDEFDKFKKEDTYVAIVQHYFVSAWVPEAAQTVEVSARKGKGGDNLIRYFAEPAVVAVGTSKAFENTLYIGPKDQESLKEIHIGLSKSVDYKLLWWIAEPLFWLMTMINSVVNNWGWSIILLTVLIKLAFFPLSASSYRSMAKMRQLTPKMQSLRENYANDRQRLSQEMMTLYKKEKVNPLGGCLPILIQMPVFLSLYWVLLESVELRHTPWILWIEDLSAMDPLFILPLIMGASMFFQQRLNPAPPDPMQAKVMQFMPVMFTVFFLFFPSGLVLYWVVNNLLSIAQQWYITRAIEAADTK